jgi:ABC-type multidrug transport system fused ATPase/permease subunit
VHILQGLSRIFYQFNASDMVLVQDAVGLKLSNVVEGVSGFIANFIFGLFTSWKLTLVVCAMSPLVYSVIMCIS